VIVGLPWPGLEARKPTRGGNDWNSLRGPVQVAGSYALERALRCRDSRRNPRITCTLILDGKHPPRGLVRSRPCFHPPPGGGRDERSSLSGVDANENEGGEISFHDFTPSRNLLRAMRADPPPPGEGKQEANVFSSNTQPVTTCEFFQRHYFWLAQFCWRCLCGPATGLSSTHLRLRPDQWRHQSHAAAACHKRHVLRSLPR